MKLISNSYQVHSYLGNNIVVPSGDRAWNEKELMILNDVGFLIWNLLKNDITEEEICNEIVSNYDVDIETARKDVRRFLKSLQKRSILQQ